MALPNLSIVNTWTTTDTGGYAAPPVPIANTEGNALIAFVGVGNENTLGLCPKSWISDDAHNWWTLATTSSSNFPGASRRLDVWVCENAKAATTISLTSSLIYAGIGAVIIEVANFPQFLSIDIAGATGGFGTSAVISGTAHQADYMLGAVAVYGAALSGAVLPAAIPTATTSGGSNDGAGDMGVIGMQPSYAAATVAAGAVSATWTWTGSLNYLAVLLAVNATPPLPVQPNPNYPGMITEAAFGWQPNAQNGTDPSWTSLGSRVTGDENSSLLHSARGRDYELTQAEAGELDVTLDNLDGNLNPLNSASPYYPNLVPEVPVRSSGYWNGRRLGIGFSYANTWPQTYPNPQWGEVAYTGKDVIGIISQGSMPSAYGGEVLADLAHSYYPLGEFYEAPHGALFANASRVNQIPAVGYSPAALGTDYQLGTGQQMNLLGDSSTGIGVTGIISTDTLMLNGAGVFVRDASLPQVAGSPNAASYECVVTGPLIAPAGTGNGKQVRVMAAFGRPGNYLNPSSLTSPGQILGVYATPTSFTVVTWNITLSDHAGNVIINASGTTGALTVAHVLAVVQANGSSYSVNLYINGTSVATGSGTSSIDTTIDMLVGGPFNPLGGQTFSNNYAVGQLAAYSYTLPSARITSHYMIAKLARANALGDSVLLRVPQLFLWSGIGVPYGFSGNFNSLQLLGNADQVQGGALADNLYNAALEEGGMYYAPATANGEVWYSTRPSLYNKAPKAILGDSPTDVNNNNPSFLNRTGWVPAFVTGTDAVDTTAQGYHSATYTVNTSGQTQAYARFTTPVVAGATYVLTGSMQLLAGGNAGQIYGSIDWYQANGTYISTSAPAIYSAPPAGVWWFIQEGTWASPITAPPLAATAQFGPTIGISAGTLNVGTQFKAAQFWLTCVSSEIPFDPGTGFDYSDTYLYNIVSSQQTLSAGTQYFIGAGGLVQQGQYSSQGVNAIAADSASEAQFFPRGPLQQPNESVSGQDSYDRANWTLASYKQPHLRANQVVVHCAQNPGVVGAILRLEQGDVVTVNRRPVGVTPISLNCMIQKIEIEAGPNLLDVTFTLSPYFPANSVLRADDATFGVLGNTSLPW